MKFRTPVWVQVEVQTPVFIWDGEVLPALSYIVDGSVIHVVDTRRFFGSLNLQEQQAYLSWMESILHRLDALDAQLQATPNDPTWRNQRRQEAAKLSLESFLSQQLRTNPVAFVKKRECVAYSVRCNACPGGEGFRSFIKETGYRPYVPGTELKGALRTALLLALVEGQGYRQLSQRLTNFRKVFQSNALSKEKRRQLSGIAPQVERALLRDSKNDAKYDLLRLLQLSDGELLTPESLSVYALDSVGTSRYTRAFAEGLKPGTVFSFRLALAAIEDIMQALKSLGLEGKAADAISLDTLLAATYQRSAALLEEDERYFQNSPPIIREIQRLKGENRPDAPLLRLGTGQGFLSVTINLPVRKRDPQLYDQAIREGVSWQRRWRTKKDNFPHTRRVVSDGRGNPQTLPGYVRLSVRTDIS